ncbi:hypothetical protein BCY84_05087 [Trypanosoma cruzi cruzi]|uniref:Uncharacterized protein n=1 Tax=Trypanosoma cruzi TaxID=5693 RepID=A0A2V2UL47_TRYCR|nr:hypothetical protein BCY84_05087 [Trypanosoma cruzi cruzi]PWU85037.1 hypothetical protein C4B63_187g28 [Trypanosoma cruzi]
MRDSTVGAAHEIWTSTVDMLESERSSLQLILDTLHATLDYHQVGRGPSNNNNDSHSLLRNGDGNVFASEGEVVELLGMLPQVLRSAADPAILQLKERQRQSMTIAGVARPPPLSRHTTLYRLMFAQAESSLSSSICSGECSVLDCIARVLISGVGTSGMSSSGILSGKPRHVFVTANREKPWFTGNVTIAALRSLGEIVELCLHDTGEETHVGGSIYSAYSGRRMTLLGGEDTVEKYKLLLDALGQSLCQTGLFDHLWHALLFHPVMNTQRIAIVRVLCDVSRVDLLRFPVVIKRTRHMMTPAVWGERVSECILSDPTAMVKESIAVMLYEGLQSVLGADRRGDDYGDHVYWRRWLTNRSLRFLLGVLATGASLAVLQPVLGSLFLVLEQDLWEGATRQRRSGRSVTERIDVTSIVEVCATVLVHLFTGPAAVNERRFDDDGDKQLKRYRFLVRGAVRLLRLALKRVDQLLGSPNIVQQPKGGGDAEKEACALLSACVEKQVLAAVMKCLEMSPDGSSMCSFVTRSMRAEMVRFVRDLLERASPPLFFLTCKLVPYLPTMLQIILDAREEGVLDDRDCCNADGGSDALPSSQLYVEALYSDGVEMISLLGMMLWFSPSVRDRFLDVLASLQFTPEQQGVFFDSMESIARSLSPHAVRNLLIVDATGTVLNEVGRLPWQGEQLQTESLERLLLLQLHRQREVVNREKVADRFTPEGRWASVQRQRWKLGPQHGHASRVLVCFVLHHLRNGSGKREVGDDHDEEDEEGEAGGVSVSPIQPSTCKSTVGQRVDGIIGEPQTIPRCGDEPILLRPRRTLPLGRQASRRGEEAEEEDVEEGSGCHESASDNLWLQRVMGSHSPDASRPKLQQTMAAPTRISASMASRNAVEPLERVRQRQLESIAAEEKAYRVALGLFASLASRYYRHLLTPQAALEYLHRQEHGAPQRRHVNPVSPTPPSARTGVNNSSTTLRLWTARDVCREDLFYFSLPLSAICEAAIADLVERCKRHRQALQRKLRTLPHSSRGRRWFLQDAATNIMGRLIALFQILLHHIQREGEKAVREAIAQMPILPEVEDEDFVNDVAERYNCRHLTLRELHGGTLVEVTKFIVRCFPCPADPGGDDATDSSFQLRMD